MSRRRDLTGMRFNRWTVLEKVNKDNVGRSKWLCKCDCGTVKVVSQQALVMNKTISCGCYRAEYARQQHITHGMKKTRLYRIYSGAKDRTCNPNSKYWKKYGGRGITMCDEWRYHSDSFIKWALENGYTDDLTLDRIDNDGNYEPSNCRWTTYKVQENNRCNTVYCLYEGERIPLTILSERLGISKACCRKEYGEKKNG